MPKPHPVMFNPYTGTQRTMEDISSDPQGILIVAPGATLTSAAGAPGRKLAALLAQAIQLDEQDGGCDMHAGLYGVYVSNLLKSWEVQTNCNSLITASNLLQLMEGVVEDLEAIVNELKLPNAAMMFRKEVQSLYAARTVLKALQEG